MDTKETIILLVTAEQELLLSIAFITAVLKKNYSSLFGIYNELFSLILKRND